MKSQFSVAALLLIVTIATPIFAKESEDHADKSSSSGDYTTETLHAQVMLDRLLFSPGAIDGISGRNAEAALEAFQQKHDLKATGQLDDETSSALLAAVKDARSDQASDEHKSSPHDAFKTPNPADAAVREYEITDKDANTSFSKTLPHDMAKLSKYDALVYTDIQEMLSERFHCTPELLEKLNPHTDWDAGAKILAPNVLPTDIEIPADKIDGKASTSKKNGRKKGKSDDSNSASSDNRTTPPAELVKGPITIIVSKEDTVLSALDENGDLAFHAPVTAGSEHDPLPLGEWKVNGTEHFPIFHFNPDLFWDAESKDEKAKIPAGPNNPVGVAWIDISKPHYGLHGTPEPSTIGYTESHGCVRLTNWDVIRLSKMAKPGTKVYFVKTAKERHEKAEELRRGKRENKDKEKSSESKSDS